VTEEQRGADEPEQPQPAAQARSALWKELAILVIVAVVVSLVVRTFLVQTFWIPSGSMEHTLDEKDRVLVNKLIYDFRDPRRGEIVVFEAPDAWRQITTDKDFIKRVIGVGGDHVVCCDSAGRITVNGTPLDEPYIFRNDAGVQDAPSLDSFDIVVPAHRLWVMGDHRSASSDSRENFRRTQDIMEATIPTSAVVGRAFVLFWPVSRFSWLTVPDTFDHIAPPGG
jgi:signal peptidase I